MRKRTANGIFKLLLIIGVILVVGSVGSSDCEMIGLTDLYIRGTVGAVLLLIGYAGLRKGGIYVR